MTTTKTNKPTLQQAITAAMAASKLSGRQHCIQERAVLVKLTISCLGNDRLDGTITSEVLQQKGMTSDAGRGWSKHLYPPAAITPIKKLGSSIRSWHYGMTLPWADEGWRLLPTANYQTYVEGINKFIEQHDETVEKHFIAKLDAWVEQMKKALNGSFDPSAYKPANELRGKFGIEQEVAPVPAGGDFRVKLTTDELSRIQKQTDSRVSHAVESAQEELWKRLLEPVQKMAETLSQPDRLVDGEALSPIFRDSLVGNIKEIADLAPKLNIAGDPAVNEFASKIKDVLGSYDPETLRQSKNTRDEAAKKADEIFSRMAGYFAPAPAPTA